MTTLSPIRRAEDNCPRLLRSNTVNQRRATAQHILNKQLPHELQNELGHETTQTAESSGQSTKTTQSTSEPTARNLQVHPFSTIALSAKTKVQKSVASSRQTKHTNTKKTSLPLHRHH